MKTRRQPCDLTAHIGLTGMIRATGYSNKTLYRLERRGVLSPFRTDFGARLYRPADVEAALAYRLRRRARVNPDFASPRSTTTNYKKDTPHA